MHTSDLYSVGVTGQLVRRRRMPAPQLGIDAHITTPWLEVNVRSLRVPAPLDAVFKPSRNYLDQALCPRSRRQQGTFLLNGPAAPFMPLGESVLVPAGQTLRVHCDAIERRVVCCMFAADYLQQLSELNNTAAHLQGCLDLRVRPVRAMMLELAREALDPGFASATLAESLMLGIAVHLARHFRDLSPASEGARLAPWQLRLIRERLELLNAPPPTLAELAQACRISARHLSRGFKNSTGMTLGQSLTDTRVRQAKGMLAEPGALIKAVAYACGFQNAAAFTAAFRKATGRTPRQYRLDTLGARACPEDLSA